MLGSRVFRCRVFLLFHAVIPVRGLQSAGCSLEFFPRLFYPVVANVKVCSSLLTFDHVSLCLFTLVYKKNERGLDSVDVEHVCIGLSMVVRVSLYLRDYNCDCICLHVKS